MILDHFYTIPQMYMYGPQTFDFQRKDIQIMINSSAHEFVTGVHAVHH